MTDATLLLRQVHPAWIQGGEITSQVFRPTPKDQMKLSAYDGDQVTAAKSWEHFTKTLHHESIGVMAVSVSECNAEKLTSTPDPTPFPEHVLIDFTGFTSGQVTSTGKRLKAAALKRGWQHQADENS